MSDLKRYDLDEIRKAVNVLFTDVKLGAGECIEVRIFDKKKNLVVAGWFDDRELLAKSVALAAKNGFGTPNTYRHIHDNVYWTCNPVNDALLSRQEKNKLDFVHDTSSDSTITRRMWLPIDIDPLRPMGVSATREEKKLAQDVANNLVEQLKLLGFPETCFVGGSSGNGYHVLIRIDLPNDNDSRDLLKQCLAALQLLVGTAKVEVDPKVYNAARIIKSYGTLSCKGMNTADRPWRWSKLTVVPETITVAPRELLEQLAEQAPARNPKRETGRAGQGPWNEDNTKGYLAWTGWHHSDAKAINGSKIMWEGECINNSEHATEARVILHPDGWWSYGCHHDSCAGVDHKAFMAHWEAEKSELYPYPGRKKRNNDNLQDLDNIDFLVGEDATIEEPSDRKPQKFNLTDAGNMERFVYRFGQLFKYCPQRDWFGWDGRRWKLDDIGLVNRAALRTVRMIPDELDLHLAEAVDVDDEGERAEITKRVFGWALQSESRSHLTAIAALSQSARGIAVSIDALDRDAWLFNCANGTLDLNANEFRKARQEDLITQLSPVIYDPNATCPLWDQFLDEIMAGNKEMIGFLQRAAGYSLTGSTVQHCMFICWGKGRNGKSTFLEVLRYIIGSYGQQAKTDTLMAKKGDEGIPNDIAKLRDARFVSAVETEDGKRLAEAKVKWMTGGDTITARFLHKEFFDFTPQFKIWMATNYRPIIHGTDEGIWRRIRLIPFTVYIPDGKKDEGLRAKLISEAPGILNWALRGLEEYKLGGLMEPDGVLAATEEYRTAEDWLARFMEAETVKDPTSSVQARALYERYKSWVKDTNEFMLKERRFNDAMDDHGFESTKVHNKKMYAGFRLLNRLENFADKVRLDTLADVI